MLESSDSKYLNTDRQLCTSKKYVNFGVHSNKSLIQNKVNVQYSEALQTNYDRLHLRLSDKGLNFGHLNIQGICGRDMSKFYEIKAILGRNTNLHILGLSETKLKYHKSSSIFHVEGFQAPFRTIVLMAVGESWYTLEAVLMQNVGKIWR